MHRSLAFLDQYHYVHNQHPPSASKFSEIVVNNKGSQAFIDYAENSYKTWDIFKISGNKSI